MAEAQKGSEQSMDDILASIRRIISDDPLAPGPAGMADSDKAGAALGNPMSSGGDFGLPDGSSSGQANLRNPTDDLSDILEPSRLPTTQPTAGGLPSATSVEERISEERSAAAWAFDRDAERNEFGGSLKDKLASLDGRGQPGGLPEQKETLGDDAATNTTDRAEQGKDRLGGAENIGVEDVSEATAGIEQSIPGAVKLSDEDAASIPSVQAVVEQTAAEARAAKPATVVQGSSTDQDGTEPPQQEDTSGHGAESSAMAPAVGAETAVASDSEAGSRGEAAPVPVVAAAAAALPEDGSGGGAKTLEALVSEALEPKLQEWLDANLPRLVEEKLQAEIERLSRDGKLKLR